MTTSLKRSLVVPVALLFLACAPKGGSQSARPKVTPAGAPGGSPSGAAADLARRLGEPGRPEELTLATAEALSRAGLATHSLGSEAHAAIEPKAPVVTPDFFVARLGADHNRAAGARRLSLAKIGLMMQRLGWNPEGHEPGEALAQVLAASVQSARVKPDDPTSFVPLFLQASISAREGVDVELIGNPPDEILLTLLELRMFLAAHVRGVPAGPRQAHALSDLVPRRLPPGATGAGALYAAPLSAPTGGGLPTICSDLLSQLGDLAPGVKHLLDQLSGSGLGAIYDRLGLRTPGGAPAYALLRVLDAVISSQNNRLDFTLRGDGAVHHKPELGVHREARLTARVAMSELTSDFEKMARDCADALGFDIDTGSSDMASWRVFWDGEDGLPDHATIPDRNNFDFANPRPGHRLRIVRAEPPKAGEASLVVDIVREEDHKPRGPTERGKAWIRAELNQAVPPQYDTLMSALATELSLPGMAQELAGVAEGLYQDLNPTVARAAVTVEWCTPHAQLWEGTVSYRSQWVRNDTTTQSANGDTTTSTMSSTDAETATIAIDGRSATASVSVERRVSGASKRTYPQMCESGRHAFEKLIRHESTLERTFTASGRVRANVGVSVGEDGEYSIAFSTPRLIGHLTQRATQLQVNCSDTFSPPDATLDQRDGCDGVSYTAHGKGAPNGPLTGSVTDKPMGEAGPTVTVSWSLRRSH